MKPYRVWAVQGHDFIMIVAINGISMPETNAFGGRIRYAVPEADIRVSCSPLHSDTARVLVAEYPQDKEFLIGFLTWQCRRFLSLDPLLDLEWQLSYSSDELSNAKSSILSGIHKQSACPRTYLVRFTDSLRLDGDERYKRKSEGEELGGDDSCEAGRGHDTAILDDKVGSVF